MSGRVIVVTGASGGLAQSLVRQLSETDSLVLLGRDKKKLAQLYAPSDHICLKECDITSEKAIVAILSEIEEAFGRIDVLINNAGYGSFKDYDDYTQDEVKAMFDVNSIAVMTFSRLVGEKMARRGSGHIVNIASMAGLMATSKASVYCASKFAVIGFSNSLRLELADKGVYVTTVNPGPIRTSFFDKADPTGGYLERVGRFVLSPDAVAKKIVKVLGKPKRELNMPYSLALAHKFYTLFPKTSDILSRKVFNLK
ncbi:SDR family NAD(P)-dependent oxidoreductase [Streptococcus sp. zg-JUN1979]|uniref:SDR family NAD(P)-dependent oxidoreductase n=1 Tax=Streptococcus sp. zg-JUN1979 TaxID=3391450 RepID=UPI0039A5734C